MAAPIVIVGAGIAGLALGLALRRRGIDTLVLEQRLGLSPEGAGIQIGPNGTRCLRALGVFDAVRVEACEPAMIAVHDGVSGAELTLLPLGAWLEKRHGAPYWVVHRHDLIRALFEAATTAGLHVRFDATIANIGHSRDDISVQLADGSSVRAAALIGADGVWSFVRNSVFDGSDAVPTGRVAARAMISGQAIEGVRGDAVSVWMAPDAHLVCYPVRRGEALNIVFVSASDNSLRRWSQPVDAHIIQQRIASLPDTLRSLIEVAENWRQWPLMTRIPLKTYAKDRVGLIGDAAHPMLPFLAQGAVMALEDALSIASHVAAPRTSITDALVAYSRDRVARTQRVVATATEQGRIYHLSGPMRHARNMALRLAPPTLMMSRYDWLYGQSLSGNAANPG